MTSVSKQIYQSILSCSERLGIFVSEDMACNTEYQERYTEQEIVNLYQKLIACSNEGIGIELARVFEFSDIGIFGEVISRTLNLQQMIKLMSVFQRHLCGDLEIGFKTRGDLSFLEFKFKKLRFKSVERQVFDFHLFVFLKYINDNFSCDIYPNFIHLNYEEPEDLSAYKNIGGKFIFSHEKCELVFDTKKIKSRNKFFVESNLNKYKQELISYFKSKSNLLDQIVIYIDTNLGHGEISLLEYSTQVNESKRSLERQIERQGLSFTDILIDRRIKKLRKLVKTNMEMSQVAQELGLYDQSSLNNFSKRFINKTPQEMRNE